MREGAAEVNDRVVLKAGVALVFASKALRTMIPMCGSFYQESTGQERSGERFRQSSAARSVRPHMPNLVETRLGDMRRANAR